MLDIGAIGDLGLGVREPEPNRGNDELGQREFLTLAEFAACVMPSQELNSHVYV